MYHTVRIPQEVLLQEGRTACSVQSNIWAGHCVTQVVIFTGILTAISFVDVLEFGLLPLLNSAYPEDHRYIHARQGLQAHQSVCSWWFEEKGEFPKQ